VTSTAPISNHTAWTIAPPPSSAPPARAERLIRGLEAHQAAEAQDVATCQALQQSVPNAAFSLLLDLVVDGAQRHQALLQTMVEHVQESDTDEPPVPYADPSSTAALRALIRDQQEGARYLRHLGRQEPALYDSMFATLLESMARDSEKHAMVLRYLLRRLEQHRG